jgi:hypothetical protein
MGFESGNTSGKRLARKGGKLMLIRQGDVLLKRVEEPSAELHRTEREFRVDGEATGHAHKLEADVYETDFSEQRRWERNVEGRPSGGWVHELLPSEDSQQFIHVKQDTDIVHEEHGPITIPAGWYEPRLQREYSPGGNRNRWLYD